ncbi:MAG: hypothetical protein ABF586_02190 [Sporolactobacillus sp.]
MRRVKDWPLMLLALLIVYLFRRRWLLLEIALLLIGGKWLLSQVDGRTIHTKN